MWPKIFHSRLSYTRPIVISITRWFLHPSCTEKDVVTYVPIIATIPPKYLVNWSMNTCTPTLPFVVNFIQHIEKVTGCCKEHLKTENSDKACGQIIVTIQCTHFGHRRAPSSTWQGNLWRRRASPIQLWRTWMSFSLVQLKPAWLGSCAFGAFHKWPVQLEELDSCPR